MARGKRAQQHRRCPARERRQRLARQQPVVCGGAESSGSSVACWEARKREQTILTAGGVLEKHTTAAAEQGRAEQCTYATQRAAAHRQKNAPRTAPICRCGRAPTPTPMTPRGRRLLRPPAAARPPAGRGSFLSGRTIAHRCLQRTRRPPRRPSAAGRAACCTTALPGIARPCLGIWCFGLFFCALCMLTRPLHDSDMWL